MKALKAFIKPYEAPQRCVKLKFNLSFISTQLSETGRYGLTGKYGFLQLIISNHVVLRFTVLPI